MRALSLLLLVGLLSGASASKASALPAWARRYNVNCSHCHAPAVPRLNATGIRFRWAGYRMPFPRRSRFLRPIQIASQEPHAA